MSGEVVSLALTAFALYIWLSKDKLFVRHGLIKSAIKDHLRNTTQDDQIKELQNKGKLPPLPLSRSRLRLATKHFSFLSLRAKFKRTKQKKEDDVKVDALEEGLPVALPIRSHTFPTVKSQAAPALPRPLPASVPPPPILKKQALSRIPSGPLPVPPQPIEPVPPPPFHAGEVESSEISAPVAIDKTPATT